MDRRRNEFREFFGYVWLFISALFMSIFDPPEPRKPMPSNLKIAIYCIVFLIVMADVGWLVLLLIDSLRR